MKNQSWNTLAVLGGRAGLVGDVADSIARKDAFGRVMIGGDAFSYTCFDSARHPLLVTFWRGPPYSESLRSLATAHSKSVILLVEPKNSSPAVEQVSRRDSFHRFGWEESTFDSTQDLRELSSPPLSIAQVVDAISAEIKRMLSVESECNLPNLAVRLSQGELPMAKDLTRIAANWPA